jgi:hypothetical protein
MRKIVLALGAIATLGVLLPITTSAQAEDRTVIIKRGDHDRGLHRGWVRGHHYGWDRDRRHATKVVVIKRSRHYGRD